MGGRRRRRKSGAVKHFNRLFSLTCREEGANSYSRIHTVFPPNILRLHPASRPSIRLPSHFRHNTTFLEYKYNVLWQISVKLMKAMRKWIYSRKVISANCHSYIGGETKHSNSRLWNIHVFQGSQAFSFHGCVTVVY